jgi:Immunity protein family (Imm11)
MPSSNEDRMSPKDRRDEYYVWEDLLVDSAKEAVLGTVPPEVASGAVRFDTGARIASSLPAVLRMAIPPALSGMVLTDNVLTYGEWALICSHKLKEVLDGVGVDNVDWYPLILDNQSTGEQIRGYWLGNVIGVLDCVDWDKTVIDEDEAFFGKLWIDPAKTKGHLIFRIADYEHHLVVHRAIKEAVEREQITGVTMSPANGYRDEGFEDEEEEEE